MRLCLWLLAVCCQPTHRASEKDATNKAFGVEGEPPLVTIVVEARQRRELTRTRLKPQQKLKSSPKLRRERFLSVHPQRQQQTKPTTSHSKELQGYDQRKAAWSPLGYLASELSAGLSGRASRLLRLYEVLQATSGAEKRLKSYHMLSSSSGCGHSGIMPMLASHGLPKPTFCLQLLINVFVPGA